MKKMIPDKAWFSTYLQTGNLPFLLVILIAQLVCPAVVFSQENNKAYTESRDKLVKTLKKRYIDKAYTQSIDHFYFNSCDSLIKEKLVIDNRPIKVILTRLFDATEHKLNSGFITSLRIPSVNNYFLQTLKIYKKQPVFNLYRAIGITQSAILESAFDGIPLGDSISTIVGIREMLANPYYISTRIQQPRYASYRDTLLYYLANEEPDMVTDKLSANDSLFTALVNNSRNRTVKAVAQLRQDNYYDNILPFGLAILENRVTADSIRNLTLLPREYYRAFIDEVIRLHTSPQPGAKTYLQLPIIDLNKKLASQYYISEVNMLHESPDKVRFQVLNGLASRELYFLLIGGSGELFTSSFLHIYKRFIKETEKGGLDKFLEEIDYYQFGQFITNISGYGLVDDLVEHVQEDKFAGLVANYFRKISSTQLTDNEVILNAMTTSEILHAISHHPIVRTILLKGIDLMEKTRASNDIMLQRMYAGFKDILQGKEFSTDATYDLLPVSRLKKQDKIVQACFFYDDEDGTSSFNSSVATYDPLYWDKEDLGNYIVFKSKVGNNMRVYMNKPMTKPGSDTAQDEMLTAINRDGYVPTSFIHRGHSYHLFQSLRKMTASGQFVFLGSCGGYNEVLRVFQLNPDVNIIVTRNIGSKLINDPLLQKINMDIVNNKDIRWDDAWKEFEAMFQSKHQKDLFSSYIPPNKYIGVKFIRKVFNY